MCRVGRSQKRKMGLFDDEIRYLYKTGEIEKAFGFVYIPHSLITSYVLSRNNVGADHEIVTEIKKYKIVLTTDLEYQLLLRKHRLNSLYVMEFYRRERQWISHLCFLMENALTPRERFYAYVILRKLNFRIKTKKDAKLLQKYVRASRSKRSPEVRWNKKSLDKFKIVSNEVLTVLGCLHQQNFPAEIKRKICSYI